MADNLGSLYGAVSQKFDIGSEADFRAKMQTTEDRKKFYDAVSGKGFDLGDYNAYETRLGEVKKKNLPNLLRAFLPSLYRRIQSLQSKLERIMY